MVRYQIPSFQNAPELPDTLLNGELSGKATLRNDNIKAIFWENRTEPQKFGIQLSDGTWKYFLADES